jgi:uncharacterized sodium:solute symporter family permease YidK
VRRIFVDTLYWLAIFVPGNEWAEAALAIDVSDALLVTTEKVVGLYLVWVLSFRSAIGPRISWWWQRVLAARDVRSAKLAPLIGSAFKMVVPFIVILPGLLGLAVLPFHLVGQSEAAATGGHSYNEVLPLMLARYCVPGLLGLGMTALIAGFMSGMAGNVSAISFSGRSLCDIPV